MSIDHIGISVLDYERSKDFYRKILDVLRIELVMEAGDWAGFGRAGKPEFWIGKGEVPIRGMHIAFAAENRAQVRRFHEIALVAGAEDHGAPGIRSTYHPNYYAAFVIDPDGYNIEAVFHHAELQKGEK